MLKNISLYEMYSLVLFAVAGIYIIIGIYALSLNIKNSLNKTFFFVNLSLSVWAFSFSLLNAAITYEDAIFWCRVSVLGWGTMYSFLLHYFLVLTDKKYFLKKKSWYVLIYLPALVNIFVFGLNTSTAQLEFELLKTNAGWINISENGFFDYFFYMYYLIYSFAGLLCVWTWKKSIQDKKAKWTAILISISFAVGIILGTFTDVLFRFYKQDIRPQLGVVFALIPILSVLYSIKKHGVMEAKFDEVRFISGRVLSHEKRVGFYKALSFVFIIGSIAYFVLDYLIFAKELTEMIKFSGFIFFLGTIIWILPHLKIKEYSQDVYLGLILATIIPVRYLHFGQYGYNSVIWTVSFFLIILTTVFKNKKLLLLVFSSAIIVELFSMISNDSFLATIGKSDYQQRTAIYILISAIIYYISRLYRQSLDEHEKQTELQKKISEISSDFVSVAINNLDDKIDDMLRKSGKYFGVDRAYLFRFSEDMSMAEYTNEWCDDDIKPAIDIIGGQFTSSIPWWMKELEQNKKVYIKDVENLPSEASSERELLMLQEVKSLISVPVLNHKKLLGFLGFDTVKSKKNWSLEHQEALQIMANIVSDAMVKVETEKKINFMAYYDALTGLSNRTYFNLQLDKMIELAKRKEKLIGILFLDLDEFKSINDTMGHDSGDKLLIEVSRRLSKVVRKSDAVCRFGGDEFLVMLPDMDEPDQIKITTEKIMEVFEKPIELKDQEFYVTASCGVAVYPVDGHDSETLIKSADLAMYESKEGGKNRFTFCTPIMKEAVKEKMQLSNDLYRALEHEEFMLYYQPQVNIESGKIIGLEALIRWNHPDRGIISPSVFIPLAEQTGLIHKIGEWVVKTACIQNKIWQSRGFSPLVMAVNLSVEQFRGNKLVEVVSNALIESNLEAKYLELEITESIAIKEPTYIIGILHQLKTLGVSISIDDFGTEYSSLSRLKELPIDRLKMAMEFVQGIDKGSKDEAIAMVIINLAKSLGLKVIAEGVEQEGQLIFLKDRICDEVQGYYFYRPMPADEIEKIMLLTHNECNYQIYRNLLSRSEYNSN